MTVCLLTLSACNQTGRVSDDVKSRLKGKAEKHLRDSEQWGKVEVKDLDGDLGDGLTSLNGVDIEGVVDIYFMQSDTTHVEVIGNAKVLSAYQYSLKDGILKVAYADEAGSRAKLPVMYMYVYAPALEKVLHSGVGDLYLEEPVVQLEDMDINVSGSGDVEINNELTCGNFNITISGSGDLDIVRVDCMDSKILVSGSGDVRIKKMTSTDDVLLKASGSGDITAKVKCQNMTAEVSGSGDADIDVKCDVVTVSSTGSGEVELEGKARKLIKSKGGFGDLSTKKLSVEELVTK